MNTVYKYEIPPQKEFELEIPEWAIVLNPALQDGKPIIWVLLDTEDEVVKRKFVFYETGEEIPEKQASNLMFLGTLMFTGDTIVSHLFEIAE